MKTIPVTAALVIDKGKFLVAQRAKGELAGYWEFESLRGHYRPSEKVLAEAWSRR